MACGGFKEGLFKRLELEEVDETTLQNLLRLSCGGAGVEVRHLGDVMVLAQIADRLQMLDVLAVLIETAIEGLSVDVCAEVLSASGACGFVRLEAQCRSLALEHFEAMARTESFIELGEEILGSLLDSDCLIASSEVAVFEAVVKWIKHSENGLQGEGLLRKVRYGLIGNDYLAGFATTALQGNTLLSSLVSEALEVKQAAREWPGKMEVLQLGDRWRMARRLRGVEWEQYESDGERLLKGHERYVYSLVECMGRVCSCSCDGIIRIWNRSTLAVERVVNHYCPCVLVCWDERLVSGDDIGTMCVWDVATGRRELMRNGHSEAIIAMTVCGARLLSGSEDKTVKVWRMLDGKLHLERTLTGHTHRVGCLAVWEDKVMSGSFDRTIRVWDVVRGTHEASLEKHTGHVLDLVMTEVGLISCSQDRTICVWAAATWELLRQVQATKESAPYWIGSLAVCGSKLITGSRSLFNYQQCEVQVWDLGSFKCEHSLSCPFESDVLCLLALNGELWGGVGCTVVVWGRE